MGGGRNCCSSEEVGATPCIPLDPIISKSPLSDASLRQALENVEIGLTSPSASVDYRIIGAGAICSLGKVERKTADTDVLVSGRIEKRQ